jgi:type IV pilus modification protein PilV
MLEALAAMMVLSLLCLSLMSFQLQSMQAQRDALSLQHALAMAQELSNRMQVHPGAWPWYQLNWDDMPAAFDCQIQTCSAQQWAQSDLADWWTELRQRLPLAKARIQTFSTDEPEVDVILAWPSATLSEISDQSAECPASYRCWSTSWRP